MLVILRWVCRRVSGEIYMKYGLVYNQKWHSFMWNIPSFSFSSDEGDGMVLWSQ